MELKNLGGNQQRILTVLSEASDEGLSVEELGIQSGLDKPRLRPAIAGLMARGLLARVAQDGGEDRLALTAWGRVRAMPVPRKGAKGKKARRQLGEFSQAVNRSLEDSIESYKSRMTGRGE